MVALFAAGAFFFGPQLRVEQIGHQVTVANGSATLKIDTTRGSFDVGFGGAASLPQGNAEARLADGSRLSTADYPLHEIHNADVRRIHDRFGSGLRIIEHHLKSGMAELRQTFWIYDRRPEIMVQISVVSRTPIGSNYLVPIVIRKRVTLPHKSPLQSLFVPYDNDSYFRYRSDGWGEDPSAGDGSYEVGAVYDDGDRNGLVVGSIDHDVWKSAIRFHRDSAGEVDEMRAVAGISGKYTHDQEPHGTVAGTEVSSPRFVVGWYSDWRTGLERFGDLNALVQPELPWKGAIPFGWNSWSGHKTKLTAEDARAATDFIRSDLSWFRSGGTAYINLDSFWDNLKPSQLQAFVDKAHSSGLKAGIYYTPFTGWGNLTDPVRGTPYTYDDLVLKGENGQPLPKLDGGWPLDPTHPGTLARIDQQMKSFVRSGFDYVKLDFMTHGSLEGRHFDPHVFTGTQAYRIGMARLVADLSESRAKRSIFISLSIAPMFPNGFAHSRRISCDVFANIGATEYFLNSANYGWWTENRLYRYNDPDSSCVYEPLGEPPVTEAESRSRFTASVIGGGMIIEGDDLTNPEACNRVRQIFSNRKLLDLARDAIAFRPIRGDTGSKGGEEFYRITNNRHTVYLALFNFDHSQTVSKQIDLAALRLPAGHWTLTDLWTHRKDMGDGRIFISIPPMDCAVLQIDQN